MFVIVYKGLYYERIIRYISSHLEVENIHFPPSAPTFSEQNYPHTINSISCQITLYNSCKNQGIEPIIYYRDIDFVGNMRRDKNLKSLTQIVTKHNWSIQPDAIIKLKSDIERMYLFEYERRGRNNIKTIFEKIHKHATILNEKYIQEEFNYKFGHRILFVFEDESTMKGAMKYCQGIGGASDWFFFKKHTDIIPQLDRKAGTYHWGEVDYFENWVDCNSNTRNILL